MTIYNGKQAHHSLMKYVSLVVPETTFWCLNILSRVKSTDDVNILQQLRCQLKGSIRCFFFFFLLHNDKYVFCIAAK